MAIDPIIGGALIGGASQLLGGLFSNDTNIKLARENRDFMERMSNSEVSRRVDDLKRAGLNPMLGYSSSASSPNSAAATVENPVGDSVSRAVETSAARLMQKAQIDNVHATTDLARTTAQKLNVEKEGAQYDTYMKELQFDLARDLLPKQMESLSAQYASSATDFERKRLDLETGRITQRIEGLRERITQGDLEASVARRLGYKMINESQLKDWQKVALRNLMDSFSRRD